MSVPDARKIVEAILFAADSSVPIDKLCAYVEEYDRKQLREALTELAATYDAEERPYALAEVAGGWQIYARPEYSKWIKELHKGRIPTRLSQAALETLAIVAYKQPIVRAEIETIRGVDSSGVLATLMRRDLITIAGRAPGMGRALMYRTTKEFLRYFGLNYVTDLPRLEEFAEVLGLKPGEMELAVEGAESVAGVAGSGGDGDEAGGDGDEAGGDGDEAGGDGDWAGAEAGLEPMAEEAEIPPPTDDELADAVPVLSETDLAEASDPSSAESERKKADGSPDDSAPAFPPHGNTHAMDDQHLINKLDED